MDKNNDYKKIPGAMPWGFLLIIVSKTYLTITFLPSTM